MVYIEDTSNGVEKRKMKHEDPEELEAAVLNTLRMAPTSPPSRAGLSAYKIALQLKIRPGRTPPVLRKLEQEDLVEVTRTLEDPRGPIPYYILTTPPELTSTEEEELSLELMRKKFIRSSQRRYKDRPRPQFPDESERRSAEVGRRHTRAEELPEYLYHDTHKENLESIRDKGLLPSPDGSVYFGTGGSPSHPSSELVRVRPEDLGGEHWFVRDRDAWRYVAGAIPPTFLEIYNEEENKWEEA